MGVDVPQHRRSSTNRDAARVLQDDVDKDDDHNSPDKIGRFRGPGARLIGVSHSCPEKMRAADAWSVKDFAILKNIGSGCASRVYHAFCKRSGTPVALKSYSKSKMNSLNFRQVEREVQLHLLLDHPNIIQLYVAFEDADHVYLVQEYASGGDLFDELRRRGGHLTEKQAVREVLKPFMSAMAYLHARNIVHRDIKPENTLFTAAHVLKIADFGLSIDVGVERPVTRLGTLDYMAPEVLVCPDKRYPDENKEMSSLWYGDLVDIWAVGVLAYEVIVGQAPFGRATRDESMKAIMCSDPKFPSWFSEGVKDFITRSLHKTARHRPSIKELLRHPWIAALEEPAPHAQVKAKFTAAVPEESAAADKIAAVHAPAASLAPANAAAAAAVAFRSPKPAAGPEDEAGKTAAAAKRREAMLKRSVTTGDLKGLAKPADTDDKRAMWRAGGEGFEGINIYVEPQASLAKGAGEPPQAMPVSKTPEPEAKSTENRLMGIKRNLTVQTQGITMRVSSESPPASPSSPMRKAGSILKPAKMSNGEETPTSRKVSIDFAVSRRSQSPKHPRPTGLSTLARATTAKRQVRKAKSQANIVRPVLDTDEDEEDDSLVGINLDLMQGVQELLRGGKPREDLLERKAASASPPATQTPPRDASPAPSRSSTDYSNPGSRRSLEKTRPAGTSCRTSLDRSTISTPCTPKGGAQPGRARIV